MGESVVSLGEVIELTMGLSPSGETYNSEGEGLPLLNGPTEFGPHHPEPTLFTTDSKRSCSTGDLIFCVRGNTTGKMNWADQPYSLGRGVAGMSTGSPATLAWVRYSLEARLEELMQAASGATMPNLRKGDLSSFPLHFPPAWEQAAASVMAIDGLIENNRMRIRVLEQMARLLYREWFVQYRFPGAEAVETVESDVGQIPKDWHVTNVGEAAENFDRFRKPLSRMEREEFQGPYPYYGAAKIFDYVADFIFDGEYLLLAEDGTVVTNDGGPVLQLVNGQFWPNNHTHVLQGTALPTRVLYLADCRKATVLFLQERPSAALRRFVFCHPKGTSSRPYDVTT